MLKTSQEGKLEGDQVADDPTATPKKTRPKGGRPSRAEASAKALLGVDLTAVDPVAILRAIAADRSMPGFTRVAACKALLGVQDQDPAQDPGGDARINARAAALMRRAN
jgi:hypothetical protein